MFQVLHSSAGAGKTHALVKHYLGHCLSTGDPSAYRQVLALTFTNKASGELKERVLLYLDDLAKAHVHDARITDLMEHLSTIANTDQATIAARAAACLKHMLHHWSDVAIGTIDSFTRRVVQPFARDLQLDHDLRMTTEEDHYRQLAVEMLIAEAGIDDRITALLSETCLQLLHEERKWDPEKPLMELSSELTKESSIKPLEALKKLSAEEIAPLADRLRAQEIAFRRRVNALGEEALALIANAGVAVEELAYGKNGFHSYFRKLCAFTDDWDPPGSNTLKAFDNEKWCSGKAGASAIAAMNGIADRLRRIFNEAEALREEHHRTYVIRRAVSRELLPAFALHELDLRLAQVKNADAVAFFSDLTRKVSEVVKHEPVPFIYERLGERYRHFLIDEFQDTSLQQWNALLPLIDNALGTGGSALLVGDAKQAIYRWRNGEVRLFIELPKLFGHEGDRISIEREAALKRAFAPIEKLAFNHRSAGTIIEFNNNLFARLKEQLAPSLLPVYDEHDQLVRSEEPGYIHLEPLAREVTGKEREEAINAFTLEAVQNSIADGFAPGDIAILVRGKKLGRQIATHLIAQGYSVVSPDGLQLSGDPVIEMLIDLLRFIHTHDHSAAARITLYQAKLRSEKGALSISPYDPGTTLPDPVALLKHWLKEHGSPRLRTTLAALIAELARAAGLHAAEDAQLLTLIDEAHAWSIDHGQDIGGFLEHWDRSGSRRSVEPPQNGGAVQVMTVHGSKGLQFPVVIVPDACMGTKGDHGERLWIDPQDAVPELEAALVKCSATLKKIGLKELQEEEELQMLDALDLLYVAFTRPEQRLYVKVPEYGADAITKELLQFMIENGRDGSLIDGERTGPWKKKDERPVIVLNDVSGDVKKFPVTIRHEAPADWDPADPDPFRSHGNVVHALLAEVRSAKDLQQAIEAAIARGDLSPEAGEALDRKLRPLIGSSEFDPWFGEELQVRNEIGIITAGGRTIRPDRVVFGKGVVRVLDIKTGKPADDHEDQVRQYMKHLRELTGSSIEGALFYVQSGTLRPVHHYGPEIHSEAI